jgi:tagatose-1,6-bisphosphate aldolase non-catalytic subunit AgaZ/GatZ
MQRPEKRKNRYMACQTCGQRMRLTYLRYWFYWVHVSVSRGRGCKRMKRLIADGKIPAPTIRRYLPEDRREN